MGESPRKSIKNKETIPENTNIYEAGKEGESEEDKQASNVVVVTLEKEEADGNH